MKIKYVSPVFLNEDGTNRVFMIPAEALKTYAKRDTALLAMMRMGGIHHGKPTPELIRMGKVHIAKPTPEFMAHRRAMLAAKRKIVLEGWYSETVA